MKRRLHTSPRRVLTAFAAATGVTTAGMLVVLLGFAIGRVEVTGPWWVLILVALFAALTLMAAGMAIWLVGHVRAVDRRLMPPMFGLLFAAVVFSTLWTQGRNLPNGMASFLPWGLWGAAFAVGTMGLFGILAGAAIWAIAYPRAVNEDRLKTQAGMFD